jgi:hypothetical protein
MAIRALHLCVLWSLAIVAPLLEELGRHAEFFVVRGNTRADILIVAFGLTLVPPLVLALLVLLAGRISPRAGELLQAVFVGVLLAVFALNVLERVVSASGPLIAGAVVLGVAAAVAYARFATARSFLTALSPAPVVFLVAFFVFSPVKELMQGTAEAKSSGVRSNIPVVLVTFDELPTITLMDARRRIDRASFPNFARLARTSTWYRNATTVADGTQLAVPSILSGQRPTSDLPTARRYPNNIFTLLGARYDLHVHEPITRVCGACDDQRSREPGSQRLGSLLSDLAVVEGHLILPRDLASGLAPIDRDFEDFGGQEAGVKAPARRTPAPASRRGSARSIAGDDLFADRLRDAERFVAQVRRPGARTPAYIAHFVVPHVPWRLLPSGRQYPVAGPSLPGSVDRVWTKDPFLVEQATQRHMLQVGYADRLLGRLVARLKAAGVWDRALVVVTADHGIGLRPTGSRREIVHDDFAAIAGVPLFVKRPSQRAGRIADQPARSIDIVPTIASALGARDLTLYDGVPLTTRPRTASHPPPVRVRHGRTGTLVSMPFDAFVRARDAELARQRRTFAHGLRSLFHIGPNQQLLGRSVSSLPVSTGAPQLHINDDQAFAFVDHRSGVVPVYVTGYFISNQGGGRQLAVAVNGRIVAVGTSYFVRDMTRFSMLIPSSSLRAGGNMIEVFAVSAGRLQLLGRAPG